MPKKKLEERLRMPCVPSAHFALSRETDGLTVGTPRRLSTLVETVSKSVPRLPPFALNSLRVFNTSIPQLLTCLSRRKPIPSHVRDIVFEIMVNDMDTDEDVEASLSIRVSLSLKHLY